ncbi:MAG TPA: helix-turn-helix transcriptional regulator [Streptosporangiaceae bacterium]|nr:helix-turn-helix transcriptional regulator [Streptosporangiaceae bacterium]
MSPVNVSTIGAYIREQREQAKISIRQLAQAAGVSNPYLSQVERGLRRPSADILQQIAKGLRISAEALYVQAGILDEKPAETTVTDAIMADPGITERQKEMLIDIYESFRKEVLAEAEAQAEARTAQADAEAQAEARAAAQADADAEAEQRAAGDGQAHGDAAGADVVGADVAGADVVGADVARGDAADQKFVAATIEAAADAEAAAEADAVAAAEAGPWAGLDAGDQVPGELPGAAEAAPLAWPAGPDPDEPSPDADAGAGTGASR